MAFRFPSSHPMGGKPTSNWLICRGCWSLAALPKDSPWKTSRSKGCSMAAVEILWRWSYSGYSCRFIFFCPVSSESDGTCLGNLNFCVSAGDHSAETRRGQGLSAARQVLMAWLWMRDQRMLAISCLDLVVSNILHFFLLFKPIFFGGDDPHWRAVSQGSVRLTFHMDEGRSLLLGALARLDFVSGRPSSDARGYPAGKRDTAGKSPSDVFLGGKSGNISLGICGKLCVHCCGGHD